jgi:DNA helicase-2/ATP-dependent DNA helicase PcrA
VVGDADQSIYAFRGATIRNIEEFEQDYPDAKVILLEQNYRSTQNILAAANAVVSRNASRIPKNLWSDQGNGPPITGYVADSEHDEAAFVAEEVDRLTDRGDATPGQVAVFYRTNAQSRVLEEVFINYKIPYKIQDLGRRGYVSNQTDWQTHGGLESGSRDVAVVEAFFLALRREWFLGQGG